MTATCKNGVGIGTGQTTGQWPEIRKDTTITINDHAKVDASGSTGIGSSGQNYGNLKIILADFAKVKATSTSGAAIGTGRDSSSKLVDIIIGTAGKTSDEEHVEVDAEWKGTNSKDYVSAAIGGGAESRGVLNILIQGGAVIKRAKTGDYGCGIGSGTNGNQANYPLSGSIIIKDDAKVEYARGWNAIGFIDDYKYKTATSELKILGNATLEDLQGYYNGIGANNVTIGDDTGKVTIKNLESSQYYYGPLIRANESLTIASNADITLTQPTQERNTTFIKAGVDADGNSIYLTKADLEKIIGEDGTGKITYRIKDKTTGEYTLQYVVHGKDGCIWVLDEDQSVASTCTTKGKVVYVCKLEDGAVNAACHYGDDGTNTRTIELELAEHTWDDGVITTDPTCTTAGKKVKHCKNAPDEESHDFVETIAVDPTNHVHIKVDGKQDATCGKPGYTGNTVCEDCNETIATGEDIPATGNHSWNAGEVTKEATCTEAGEKTYTCTVCSETKTEAVDALDHEWNVWHVTKKATCKEEGKIQRECQRAGCTEVETQPIQADPDAHAWDEWTITKKATCTEDGVETRECKNDPEHKETRKIDAAGHKYGEWETVTDATCTTEGEEKHTCSECGDVETRKTEIDPNAHNYQDDWTVTTKPGCTTKGEETRYCHNNAEHTETRGVDPTGHTWGDGAAHKETEVIKATGHQHLTEGVDKKDPTCEEPGYTGDTVCDTCGKVLESGTVLPATGSNDSNAARELRVVVPGSTLRELWFTVRQSGGERTYTCKQDNATLTGSLETLQYLQSQGADTIVFVTNGRVSRFAVADLLALCNEGDVFYLCHTADAEPTLLIIANDHTELLNS